jgi:hypothetical protein
LHKVRASDCLFITLNGDKDGYIKIFDQNFMEYADIFDQNYMEYRFILPNFQDKTLRGLPGVIEVIEAYLNEFWMGKVILLWI